ncbi:LacI family DNA-binding transcriptional regulator [Eubacterium oxidoreducens]|uniref:Transcriptional regulator, LacI family n=1 Tax=Eubacterium oxidoreducens TaxID=1732 RepID=A0A1G6A4X9_EUBOX|nr:LacI family DNA-binding transcriptional regulator [Eubacterium oxidoreducens]SDB03467.1 transcriptional regulator, LacI family [Eubacterium oxidoreducens]
MASIKEIAKKAGVSPSTVSRVLNQPDYQCRDHTARDRIWEAAIELHYAPNQAARNLRKSSSQDTHKTFYLNVLMTRSEAKQPDPFFTELLRIIESQIHNHGHILTNIWHMPDFSDDRKCNRLNLAQLVDELYAETDQHNNGLIIIGRCNQTVIKLLQKKFKNLISINRNSTNYAIDEVLCDGEKVACIATEYLISLGHSSIGYVGACYGEARYRGFQKTMAKHQLYLDPAFVCETHQTEREGYQAMEHFLKMQERPSAIYCANDITAIGLLKCMNRYRALPYRPAIIASDNIDQAQNIHPMLTTIALPKEEMGKFAIQLLLDRIQGGHESIIRMELEGRLLVRNSCSKLK